MSSQPHFARDAIPVGDIELHDNYLPGLPAGDYSIEVSHDLLTGTGSGASSIIDRGPFEATQQFTVRGPQVSIDPSAVLAKQPPDSSSGRFAEVLPHVVLGDPMLPWERAMDDVPKGTPWLALLVLTDDELVGGTTDRTRTISATVGDFIAPDGDALEPSLNIEPDIALDSPCSYIQVTTEAFRAVAPRLDEAYFLTHSRAANTGDRPILGIDGDGLFSVVVAGRFPVSPAKRPADSKPDSIKNIVHLVSLDGHQKILGDNPDFGGHSSVAMLSLCSWSFWCYADRQGDFRELAEGLRHPPEHMWLRVPSCDLGDGAAQRQAARRLDDGYVPLPYTTRSGEGTYGWYRGPFTPVVPVATPQAATATAADALIGYDPVWGTFDVSLAAAFELGRALAVADSAFAQQLVTLKRAARGIVDGLYQQSTSTHIPEGSGSATAVQAFGVMLGGPLLSTLGAQPTANTDVWSPPAPAAPTANLKQALAEFLQYDQTTSGLQDALNDQLADYLTPVADWLAQRMLLYGVPFTHLVPDERMLPTESLRFFHVDTNWLDALVSGAFSVGAQSSRDTAQDAIIGAAVRDMAARQAEAHRDTVRQATVRRPATAANVQALHTVSGFLLRSAIVSGWPNLAVRGYAPNGQPLPVLRMDHLSPTVLLCLFDGIPATVELRQPQESFQFGTDDDGIIPLRNMLPKSESPGGAMKLGEAFDPEISFNVSHYLRSNDHRVLTLNSLVQDLNQALIDNHAQSAGGTFGPADLAMQMVRVPEAIKFNGPA